MAINAKQQNLINDLKAPTKSFRLFALENAIKTGDSPEILSTLEELSLTEDDAECQMLITHAIASVKSKLSDTTESKATIKEKEIFLQEWNKANDEEKLTLLGNLPPRLPKKLRGMGPELISENISSVLEAKIIRSFCRFWPEDQFDKIVVHLDSESLSLKLAALRTLVHINPQLLIPHLPTLLKSEDPQIKALSIRALAKIDKEEALKYLQALLLSSSVSDRLAGIQNCPFLPFEMVKPVLLKYFSAENHPELLIRAGWILEMNPDVYVPFKLFEIAERSPAKKAKLVKEILNEAVKLLDKSGIIGDKFAEYINKLQAWVNTRNAQRFVRNIVAKIDAGHITSEIEHIISQKIKNNHVRKVLQDSLDWPVSDIVKNKVKALLSTETASGQPVQENKEVPQTAQSRTKFSSKSDKCLQEITGLSSETYDNHLDEINQMMLSPNCSESVKIAIFHTALNLNKTGHEEIAEKLISGKSTSLATAAVTYLGAIDPERVFPYLGKCLRVADIEMKSAALGILKQFDFNQAVSSLSAMLNSRDPKQQEMALECSAQFDFTLIREELTEYMIKCRDRKLIEKALCHFAANPAKENIYLLYKIEKAQSGNNAQMVSSVRLKCEQQVQSSDIESESKVPEKINLEEKWKQEQEKKRSKKPAYAYKKSSQAERKATASEVVSALSEKVSDFLQSKGAWVGFAIVLCISAIMWILFKPGKGIDTKKERGGAVIAQALTLEGKVTNIKNGVVFFKATNSDEFLISPGRDGYRIPKRGMKLRVSLLPYRKTSDNKYFARIRGIREIESFSNTSKKD